MTVFVLLKLNLKMRNSPETDLICEFVTRLQETNELGPKEMSVGHNFMHF